MSSNDPFAQLGPFAAGVVKGIIQAKLRQIVEEANAVRGAWLIKQAQDEYPQFSGFIKDLLSGSPEDVAKRVKQNLNFTIPRSAYALIAEIQEKLKFEIAKPRFGSSQRRLKG